MSYHDNLCHSTTKALTLQLWCQMPNITITTIDEFAQIPPANLFSRIAHLTDSLFLDSANNSGVDAGFDILLFSPVASLSLTHGHYDIHTAPNQQALIDTRLRDKIAQQRDPFVALGVLHDQLITPHAHAISALPQDAAALAKRLPFLVGCAGFAGYDSGRYLETIPNVAEDEYATPDFRFGVYAQSIIFDRCAGQYYYVALPQYEAVSQATMALLRQPNSATNQVPFALTNQWQANMTKAQYIDKIDALHQYIKAGDCYQTNLAQRFDADYTGNEFAGYMRLRQQNNAPFSAFIKTSQGAILSISPERFLQVTDGEVQTKPIKGTMPRFTDATEDQQSAQRLLASSKDQAENLMIVDLLRNDLSKHCSAHSVKVPKLFALETYAAVHHMVSTVTGTLSPDSDVFRLLSGAFPGGSITGAPKLRAMQIIEELEPNRRNIYCGSIGYIGLQGDMDTNICIRTLLCENNRIYCWAGGGIVLDSEAHSEYAESLAKVSKILPVLAPQ